MTKRPTLVVTVAGPLVLLRIIKFDLRSGGRMLYPSSSTSGGLVLRLTLPVAGGWAASRLEGRAAWRPAQTTSEPFRFALAGTESI